jgi:hypothetical protein
MQGVFENPADRDRIEDNKCYENADSEEDTNHTTGRSKVPADSKRARLDAIANAPWSNLAPSNDKSTQQRMREHRGQQAKYESLTDDRKQYIPKVNPYPEAPDCVFPGTPCYKINVNGTSRTIFVIDPNSPGYDRGWPGRCRLQTTAWWIVPHFVFRDENAVSLAKTKWMTVYDWNTRLGNQPEGKTDYDSQLLGGPPPAGAQPLLPALAGTGIPND